MRPGTNLVKITTDPTVYAVEPGGELRSIVSEDNAKDLYGDNWASRVVDVPDAFFVNYEQGSALTVGEYPTGTLVQEEGSSDVYFVDNGDYRAFSGEAAFLANNFKFSDVITTSETITANGSEITGFDTELFNPAGGATTGSGSVATGTGLSAALSASTPAAQSIPYNVQGQVYTSVNLTASNDGAVELTGLEVRRTGLGETSSFDKVYVEVDGVRHGNKRTLGSDNIANLYFNTDSSKITIPAGQTVTLDIVADMDMDETGTHSGDNALSIVSASSVDTNATVSGSFPITGNLMSISSVGAPKVSLDLGSGADEVVYLGDVQVEVSEFDIDNNSDNEDISFTEITLENSGSADYNEVVNYTLYNDSDEVISGPVDADSNDMIKFVLDDAMTIEDNKSETFVVKADIYDGREETVKLSLDESTDVKTVGLNNGFNGVISETENLDLYTIEGGDLNFTEADSNPGDTNVAREQEDVLFLAAEVESLEEMMTITELKIDVTTTEAATSIEDVTLYLDGDVVAGPSLFNDDEFANTITFDEEFQVNGTQLLEVKADIASDADITDYYFTLDSDYVIAENEEGDEIADTSKIKGSVTGATISVEQGTLTLAADGTWSPGSVVAGSEAIQIGQFILEAGEAEDVEIDSYKVNLKVDSGFNLADVDELTISESSDVKSSNLDSEVTFNVSNQTLAANETKVVKVYVLVDSDVASGNLIANLAVEGTGVTSDKEANSNVLDGQTASFADGILNISLSAGTPDSDIILAGSNNVFLGEYEFESENVGYTVKDLEVKVAQEDTLNRAVRTITLAGTPADGETATTTLPTIDGTEDVTFTSVLSDLSSTTANLTAAIDASDYWRATDDGTDTVTLTATYLGDWANSPTALTYDVGSTALTVNQTLTSASSYTIEESLFTNMTIGDETVLVQNGVATFNDEIVVPKDEDVKVKVYGTVNSSFNAITSLDTGNLVVTSYEKKADNENTYTKVEGNEIPTNEVMVVTKTKPTITTAAGETSSLKKTDNKIMDITITADVAGEVTINGTGIDVYTNSTTTGQTMTLEIKDGDTLVGTAVTANDSSIIGIHNYTWTDNNIISAGETKTYTVYVSFSVEPEPDKMLEVSLVTDSFNWSDGKDDSISTYVNLIDDLSGTYSIDNK
jgi:hypothetical protein